MPEPDEYIAQAVHSSCTPREFEALVATLYEENGHRTEMRPPGADQGVDILAQEGGFVTAIQVKRFSADNKVGSPIVRETVGSARAMGADNAAVVTTSLFTQPAKEVVAGMDNDMDVELVDGVELVRRLNDGNIKAIDGLDLHETSGGVTTQSRDGFVSELQRHMANEAEKEAKDMESKLVRYLRDRFEQDYKDQLEAKVSELGGYLVDRATDVDFRDRAAETKGRLGHVSDHAANRATDVKSGAVERASGAKDRVGETTAVAKDEAVETAAEAMERADKKSERAKEKAGQASEVTKEKAEGAKNKAKDVKDRFF